VPSLKNTASIFILKKRKKTFQYRKSAIPIFFKAFQISSNYFSFHRQVVCITAMINLHTFSALEIHMYILCLKQFFPAKWSAGVIDVTV